MLGGPGGPGGLKAPQGLNAMLKPVANSPISMMRDGGDSPAKKVVGKRASDDGQGTSLSPCTERVEVRLPSRSRQSSGASFSLAGARGHRETPLIFKEHGPGTVDSEAPAGAAAWPQSQISTVDFSAT